MKKNSPRAALTLLATRIEAFKNEADGRATALTDKLSMAKVDARSKLQDRVSRGATAYRGRGVKLLRAWGLTQEALGV